MPIMIVPFVGKFALSIQKKIELTLCIHVNIGTYWISATTATQISDISIGVKKKKI